MDTPHASKALFAAGCFWGVQYYFDQVPGVVKTTVGYTGGHTENPRFDDVCTHTTGHAEAVLIEFDSKEVAYETLVKQFFRMHDPTQLNRQGPDIGDEYRSAIFYFDQEQRSTAIQVRNKLQKVAEALQRRLGDISLILNQRSETSRWIEGSEIPPSVLPFLLGETDTSSLSPSAEAVAEIRVYPKKPGRSPTTLIGQISLLLYNQGQAGMEKPTSVDYIVFREGETHRLARQTLTDLLQLEEAMKAAAGNHNRIFEAVSLFITNQAAAKVAQTEADELFNFIENFPT